MEQYELLNQIDSPNDVKKLSESELKRLCSEIRHEIITTISKTGGHLSSNLGVVELTVALHRVFDSPNDKIVWDVGHQCYTHKLLTGRKDRFSTIRQEGGISGFPKPAESEHDSFIAGHSTNSISAACGIARAELLKGTDNTVIAVIGDGAFTGGMAYEALNNAASLTNLIVILNYNEMSISKTVGSFARYLSNLRSQPTYLKTKSSVETVLDRTPLVGKPLKRMLSHSKHRIKDILYHANFFTDLGFAYLGPVDGHDLNELNQALNWARETDKPALIQVFTKKGKGYLQAEQNPGAYHGVSHFDIATGNPDVSGDNSFSAVFGKELSRLAHADHTICAVTAAMKYGTGLQYFARSHPDRFFDVGIAEQHAVTFCSGLASDGMKPVFAVYSTFLQRGFDQVIHDAAIANNHVVLGVDRAGIVGDDGETHQGVFDVSFLSDIPNTTIFSPTSYQELKALLPRALYDTDGVVAIRYPRGDEQPFLYFQDPAADYQIFGGGETLLITYGRLAVEALQAAQILAERGTAVTVLKLTKIHPLPEGIDQLLKPYHRIFFFEEGSRSGGIGEHLAGRLIERDFCGVYRYYGVPNRFIPQSSVPSMLKQLGLDASGMVQAIQQNSVVNQ